MIVQRVDNDYCIDEVLAVVDHVAKTDNIPDLTNEVKEALETSNAFLFMNDEGFFILQPCEHKDEVAVNLLFAFNRSGDAIKRYLPTVISLAQRISARYITGYTRHKGILEIVKQVGFAPFGVNEQGLFRFVKEIGGNHG